MDSNKQFRDSQRRILHKAGWAAVYALKDNGSWYWKWIHPSRKKAYSREQAFDLATRRRQTV